MLYFSNNIFIVALISIALAAFFNTSSPLLITLALIPFVIGQIIPSNILYPVALNFIPEAKGKSSAIMQGGRLILSSLSLQLAGHFYSGSFQSLGIILFCFMLIVVSTLFGVIQNDKILKFPREKTNAA